MPMRIMSAREIAARQKQPTAKRKPELSETAKFIKKMKPGQSAHIDMAEEKVTRQAVKLRIQNAAKAAGVQVKFLRSEATEVIFTRV